jgi:hypothetical protein
MSQQENPGPNSPLSEASTAELERQLAARKAAKEEKAKAVRDQEAAQATIRDLQAQLSAALRQAEQLAGSSKVGESSGAQKTPTKVVGPTPPSAKRKVPYVSVPPADTGSAGGSPKRKRIAAPEADDEVETTPRAKGKGKDVDPAERGEPDKSGKKARLSPFVGEVG